MFLPFKKLDEMEEVGAKLFFLIRIINYLSVLCFIQPKESLNGSQRILP